MLTVVIPALNEERAIAETIDRIREVLTGSSIEHEIILVNDGSSDRTGEIARERSVRVVDHPVPGGYGHSLKDGILVAKYDLIAITDADGTYPCDRLPELFDLVAKKGFDMAVGARTGPEYRGTFMKMPARRVFLWLSEYATGRKIDDINSGLRVFRKEIVLRYIGTISDGFSFTTTISLAAMLNGYFVKYVPVAYHKRIGKSHVRYVRDTLRSLQIIVESILYYNPLKLFLLVASMLLGLGVVGAAVAAVGHQYAPVVFAGSFFAASTVVAAFLIGAIGLLAVLTRRVSEADSELRWRGGRMASRTSHAAFREDAES
jgi:glycosyltransferase involved in cell wall biosynthesis